MSKDDYVHVTTFRCHVSVANFTHLFWKILTLIYALAAFLQNKDLMCILDREMGRCFIYCRFELTSLGIFLGKFVAAVIVKTRVSFMQIVDF